MFSINTKRRKWWQQLIFLQCLPCADRGSKCITCIILYIIHIILYNASHILSYYPQHQWGRCCYCGCTKPGLLIPPSGKLICCHQVVMEEKTWQLLPGQARRMGSSRSKDLTPQWLWGLFSQEMVRERISACLICSWTFWLAGSEVTEWYLGVNLNLLVPISLESVYLPVVSS